MQIDTILPPNFMDRIVKEIQTRICIDDADVEILEELLNAALNEYCTLLNGYYEEEYSIARRKAYAVGHSEGYADGYYDSRSEGYSDGYYVGYDDGRSEGYY